MDKRIVVTGIGAVTSIGIGKQAFWEALIKGRSGISEISAFDSSAFPTHYAGEVKDFRPADFINPKKTRYLGRASCLAIASAKLALDDSGLKLSAFDRERIGAVIGTTMGETQIFEQANAAWVKNGAEAVDPWHICALPANVISCNLAIELKLKGPNYVIPTACAAGNYSIGYACDLIRKGQADIMFAGGADAFSKIAFTGFSRMRAVAPKACQPFDKNRKGMLVGEGSAILVLEKLEDALKRGADIYAEILGYGLSCDAHHMTAPNASGIARAIAKALAASGLKAADIDYINAHGTGTPANDKEECLAIKEVFGSLAKTVPVSSIKSMLGHTMGAASAIEAACCCLAVKNGIIPPTINYETPDPECDIDCVPNLIRKAKADAVLNNASAFGGNNACLAIKKFI